MATRYELPSREDLIAQRAEIVRQSDALHREKGLREIHDYLLRDGRTAINRGIFAYYREDIEKAGYYVRYSSDSDGFPVITLSLEEY